MKGNGPNCSHPESRNKRDGVGKALKKKKSKTFSLVDLEDISCHEFCICKEKISAHKLGELGGELLPGWASDENAAQPRPGLRSCDTLSRGPAKLC